MVRQTCVAHAGQVVVTGPAELDDILDGDASRVSAPPGVPPEPLTAKSFKSETEAEVCAFLLHRDTDLGALYLQWATDAPAAALARVEP